MISQDEIRFAISKISEQESALTEEIEGLEDRLAKKKALRTTLAIVEQMFDQLLATNPPV